jgi:hypothetical protein
VGLGASLAPWPVHQPVRSRAESLTVAVAGLRGRCLKSVGIESRERITLLVQVVVEAVGIAGRIFLQPTSENR